MQLHDSKGEWLSLVEHLVRDQGVGGSNPLSPTNIFNSLQPFYPKQKIRCRRICSGQSLQVQQVENLNGHFTHDPEALVGLRAETRTFNAPTKLLTPQFLNS